MKVLVLAPHTDDGEFGCGATIAKMIEEGNEVYYAAFSACKQSVRSDLPSNILEIEVRAATKELGIAEDHLMLFDYDVRTFNYRRQEILDDILKIRAVTKPDMVFMPSTNDIHQDHYTIAFEGIRAFKNSTILCYEVPWNNFTFHTTAFEVISKHHLQAKVNAISKYESQKGRPYANEDFIRSLAKTRGIQIGKEYAEVFEVVRWIL